MAQVLLTGCNRGIGLELCRQYNARGDDVIGVCRNSSAELGELGIRVIDGVDVAEDSSVAGLAEKLDGIVLNILINNAGILRRDTFDTVNYDEMIEQFNVNSIGPLRVVRALRDNLGKGAKIGIITSRVGSIEDNGSGKYYGYRCSKAAANMIGKNLQHDLEPAGIAIALLHPGYVATGMTDGQGISSKDSATGLIARMDELSLKNSGRFWHAEGYDLPW
jgi:NAD(P)-dependent dehydrogenase (short-subunit alcohol dehydrogenase family)